MTNSAIALQLAGVESRGVLQQEDSARTCHLKQSRPLRPLDKIEIEMLAQHLGVGIVP